MPRVSEQHLTARRQQILDAASVCFRHNGFHATSMQDVIAEAGLSVGAVYRYFRSKNEIITAIAEQVADRMIAALADLAAAEDLSLPDAMGLAVGLIDANAGPDGHLPLALQIWSEAQRDPAVADLAREVYRRVLANYAMLARKARERGELPAEADPDATGAALAALALGYALLRLITGGPDLETYRAGLRAVLAG
jgi:AcrR family transcriptional regulator